MADNKKVIKLGLDYSEFSGGVTEINRKMQVLDSEFRKVSEGSKEFATETDKLRLKQEQLTQKIHLQTEKVNNSKLAYDKAVESGKATDKQLDNLLKNYNNNQTALNKLNNELSNNEDKLTKAKYSLDSFGSSLGMNADQIAKVEGALDKASKSLLALGVASATMYTNFDENFAKVNTLADTTVVSLEDLKDGVIEISKETGKGATDIANALYDALSSNVDTADALHVTADAAKLAKAGFTETATSVDILTSIMNSYGKSAEETNQISDMLVRTQKVGKLTVGELGDSFGKVAGLASEANVPLEDLLASIATITQSGMPASGAITGIQAAISNIIKPTGQASEEAKKLGLRFDSTALSSMGLADFLEMVQVKSKGNIDTMAKLFGSTQAVNSVLQLTSEKGGANFKNALDEIMNSTGATDEAINNLDSTGVNFKESLERVKTSLIEVGEVFSPIIEKLSEMLNFISNINPEMMALVVIIGTVMVVVKGITAVMAGLAAANIIAGTTTMGVLASFSALLPVLLIAAGVLALISGGVAKFTNSMKEVEDSANNVINSTQNAVAQSNPPPQQQPRNPRGNAFGTDNYEGGDTWVGEDGPELVNLPRGSRINSNAKSREIMGGNTYISITIDAKNVKEMNDVIDTAMRYKQSNRQGVLNIG